MARTLRLCDICGIQDSHPRHVRSVDSGGTPSNEFLKALPAGTDPLAIAELLDPTTVVRHIDCDAKSGCVSCTELWKASGNKTGDALLTYITTGA